MVFERLWRARRTPARGARDVESANLVFSTLDGASAAMRVAPDLSRYVLLYGEGLTPTADRVQLGDEALVLADRETAAVVWRSGNVVSFLQVRGRTSRFAKQVMVALARRQQERISKPTALPPGVNDDREVMLDNPRLRIKVYWLGLSFRPGRGLPRVDLGTIFGPESERELGLTASLVYENRRNGVTLDLWKPKRWARALQSQRRRPFWERPCARRRVVQVRSGSAELFRSCSKRRPAFVAIVHVPGAVLDIGTYCLRCQTEGGGAYGSFKGLTTIVRGLRLRRR